MKYFVRSCLFALTFVAPWSYAADPDASLVGCWRSVKITLYAQDGSKTEDNSGRCIRQFKADLIESTCRTSNGVSTTTYKYRIDRPNFYLATMAGSTFKTDMLGSTREYEYRIDGDLLVTATAPKTTLPAPPVAATRVEALAIRAPCE
ncbi:MAG: hypothetical protein ACTS8S_17810 [Giesbergeria sp.]